jgi:hypothetical protein
MAGIEQRLVKRGITLPAPMQLPSHQHDPNNNATRTKPPGAKAP